MMRAEVLHMIEQVIEKERSRLAQIIRKHAKRAADETVLLEIADEIEKNASRAT